MRLSAVMPSSDMTMSPGAEKPKRSTPTTLPSRPTYLYHMLVTPASMATRLVHDLGRTSCLYESGWRSKMSMHGIETTRTPSPSASAAFIACCTSEPDAMMISLRSPLSFLATYAPLRTPSRRVFTGIDLRVSTFWRVRISDVGPSMRCCECTYAPTVSSGSAGRMTSMLGNVRSDDTVSTGWWVGPSSPTPMESCVRMYVTGSSASAATRRVARM
mmetsp:Transcript_130491/g.194283  ORF Transcript_130491/g.194283 Transcript_130491/m.194283 type:complete len:216 (+) Transcript_130491:134-781(+)